MIFQFQAPDRPCLCEPFANLSHMASRHKKEFERGEIGFYFGAPGTCMECYRLELPANTRVNVDHVHPYEIPRTGPTKRVIDEFEDESGVL